MRLKTFYAKNMTEAMHMIRESLGEDAIIVATGEEPSQRGVRVTAAIDEPAFEIGDASPDGWLQYDDEQDENAVAEELTDTLLRHSVPEDIMDHMISCTTVMGYDDVGIAFTSTIDELFSFSPLFQTQSRKPVVMVGPPGAGKTLAVAKLAARSTMNGQTIGVVSTDTQRAGGIEQLKAFTDLMHTPLHKAPTPIGLRNSVESLMQKHHQVVIDTAGLNPFDTDDIRSLARLLGAVDAQPVLVLPAGIEAEEAGEIARVFSTLGAEHLLPTRVDIARRLGNLLCAAHQGGLSFCDFSNTHKVADGLKPLSPLALAQLFMPRLYKTAKDDIVSHNASQDRALRTGSMQ